MKNLQGEKLVVAAASIAVKLSEGTDYDELCALIELISLIKSNLEGIRFRRLTLESLKTKQAQNYKTTFSPHK